ncbi:MAG: TMEM165/GDT1 family protein [Polyangiaceae bacterium]
MPHLLEVALSVYCVIFIAELPDKTALAALVLGTRHKAAPVFLGAAAALAVQSLVAVAAGQLFSLLPRRTVHIVAGIIFIISAMVMWLRHEDDDPEGNANAEPTGFWRAVSLSFGVVFIAEWGDLTQIATAAFAARYRAPVTVFLAATGALWSVAAIAALLGSHAKRFLSPRITQKVAAALFALVGVAVLASARHS